MGTASKHIHIPELSLVVLMGASGSGKSTFARTHFKPTEIVSSDVCRGMVSDDENNQAASADAFELARFIVSKRLQNGLLTVVDATNVQEEARKDWVKMARLYKEPLRRIHECAFGVLALESEPVDPAL